MSFAAPWMLLGLVAVGLPIWLHLRRRPLVPIPFPALPLLQKVTKQRSPKLRIRQFLLLFLRIFVLAAIVLAAAKPSIFVLRPGGIRKGAPLAMVIVLDNSLSMKLQDENGQQLFDLAKEAAFTELDRLRPGDAAALISTCPQPGQTNPSLDFDLVSTRSQIESSDATYARSDMTRALNSALTLLEESPLTQREVLLISDLAENGNPEEIPPWSKKTGIGFRVLDAGPHVRRENHAVEQIRAGPSPEGVLREVLVNARIANYSNKNIKGLDVILEVEGAEVARGSVDIRARQSVQKKFYHRFKRDGLFRGLVKIEDDRLPEDNIRHFTQFVSHSITALIINGDHRPGSYHDEAFYLNRALQTPMPQEVPISTVVVDLETAQKEPLTGNDVIFLAGVTDLPAGLADRLLEYVKNGGGLFISPGENSGHFQAIDAILPAKVRSTRHATRRNRAFSIGPVNRAHPVFIPFGQSATGLESTEVYAHLLVEPEPSVDKITLVTTTDGLPLLLERAAESGRTMLLTTTIDRAWTDLPIRPGYLPLIQRAARHLSGRLDDRSPRRVEVGRTVPLEVSAGMRRLTVRGPKGQDTVYTAQQLDGRSQVEFKQTTLPGDYVVWAEIPSVGGLRELPSLGFTVETSPLESNPIRQLKPANQMGDGHFAPLEGKLPIWPYLLLAAFLFFLAEAVVSSTGLRRSHVKQQ